MTQALMLVLLGVLPGLAIGAGLTLAIAHSRGMFKPEVKVRISVVPGDNVASMAAAMPNEYTVVVRPTMLVNWEIVYAAAAGSGYAVVPKEFAPPQH